MKPIPPGHSEAADNAPIPGRPWWRAREDVPPPTRDFEIGTVVFHRARVVFARPDGAGGYLLATSPREAEEFDAARPLPHPGYRAGQVWLVPNGATYHLRVLNRTVGGDDGRYTAALCVVLPGGCFLLHDPLMPSRAPWGPA